MKFFLYFSLFFPFFLIGCQTPTTVEEIPDHKRTFLTHVHTAMPMVYSRKVPMEVMDFKVDKEGFIEKMGLKVIEKQMYFTIPKRMMRNGELQTEFCFAYDYWMKSKEISDPVEVPITECHQGILEKRESALLLHKFIDTWVYRATAWFNGLFISPEIDR